MYHSAAVLVNRSVGGVQGFAGLPPPPWVDSLNLLEQDAQTCFVSGAGAGFLLPSGGIGLSLVPEPCHVVSQRNPLRVCNVLP